MASESNQQLYKVKFNYANNLKERKIVHQYLLNKYKDDDIKKEQIGIDLYDIDGDGCNKKIFVYVNNSAY